MKTRKHPVKHHTPKKSTPHAARAKAAGKKRGLGLTLMAVADPPKRSGASKSKPSVSLQNMRIADFYRPLKKPITVRLDVDVLAWFKKDGRHYQRRINQALRKIMEKEIKESGL
jgi:uncharacterized protein (DUF4415 family)